MIEALKITAMIFLPALLLCVIWSAMLMTYSWWQTLGQRLHPWHQRSKCRRCRQDEWARGGWEH